MAILGQGLNQSGWICICLSYLAWGGEEEHYSLNEVESLKSETQDLEKQSGTQCWDGLATKQLASSRSASVWFGLTVKV